MSGPTRDSIILIDTNAIQAAHRFNCWNALRQSFQLHTVALCIDEATRPDKKGRRLVNRNPAELASDFAHIASPSKLDKARLMLDIGNRNDVDDGERDLLAYARTLPGNVWWLCGPDNGTVFAMRILKIFDRMVSLESIARACGQNIGKLPQNYTERWLADHRTRFLLEDL